MINIQIGDNDLYGKRFNGHDLHKYLIERGIESKHLVWRKLSNDENTFEIADNIVGRYAFNDAIQNIEYKFSLQSILYPFSHQLLFSKYFLEADVVHYHLIHNYFFTIYLLPILSRFKPSVWTIHDPWALTGHCVYPLSCTRWKDGCGDCPQLDTYFPIEKDTSALNWEIKRIIYDNSDIDIVVASKWMLNLIKESPLLSKFKLHHIPFGINLEKFCPKDNILAKKELGIAADRIVLCFRANTSQFKGISYIRDVLRNFRTNTPICLLTFNDVGLMNEFKSKYQIIDLGWVSDDDKMINAYNASDIFLMPSTAEAFGLMAIEAMACAKPVIVMDGTSLPEVVFAPKGGISVPQGDTEALLRETERLINNPQERKQLGDKALCIAREYYNLDGYIQKLIDLYHEVFERKKGNYRYAYISEQLKKIELEQFDLKDFFPESTPPIPPEVPPLSPEVEYMLSKLLSNRIVNFLYLKTIKPTIKVIFSRNKKGAKFTHVDLE